MNEVADVDLTAMAMGGEQRPGDEKLYVRFFIDTLPDEKATNEAGRPIYKEVEFVEIMQPGNKDSVIQRPVRKNDIQRFPRQYQQFKNNMEETVEGTPLEAWPLLSRAQVEELRYFNVRTVEQLASMTDANAQNFVGMQNLKLKAQAFLETTGQSSEGAKLAQKVEDQELQIQTLSENNEALMKRIQELEDSRKQEEGD